MNIYFLDFEKLLLFDCQGRGYLKTPSLLNQAFKALSQSNLKLFVQAIKQSVSEVIEAQKRNNRRKKKDKFLSEIEFYSVPTIKKHRNHETITSNKIPTNTIALNNTTELNVSFYTRKAV